MMRDAADSDAAREEAISSSDTPILPLKLFALLIFLLPLPVGGEKETEEGDESEVFED